jgi:hypothetical protein
MKRILAIVCLLVAVAIASAQEWAWPVLARQASQTHGSTPATLPPLYGDALVAWYKFDADINDYSGNGYNGAWDGTGAPRYEDGAVVLNGLGNVRVPSAMASLASMTIAVRGYQVTVGASSQWAYFATNSQNAVTFGQYSGAGGSPLRMRGIKGSTVQWDANSVGFGASKWYSAAMTWTNNDMRGYLLAPGASVVTQHMSDVSCDMTGIKGIRYSFGEFNGVDAPTNTRFSCALVFNRVLTSNEAVAVVEWLNKGD